MNDRIVLPPLDPLEERILSSVARAGQSGDRLSVRDMLGHNELGAPATIHSRLKSMRSKGWIALACVVAAAFAYPLGNRGLLLHLERQGAALNASQRVFGLTLASQPAFLALAAWAWWQAGPPAMSQVWLAAGVALSAGVIATILFFQATGMVRDNPSALGAAEAMQGAEVLLAVLLGVAFLGEPWPGLQSGLGALLVVVGIVLFAWVVARDAAHDQRQVQALRSERGG